MFQICDENGTKHKPLTFKFDGAAGQSYRVFAGDGLTVDTTFEPHALGTYMTQGRIAIGTNEIYVVNTGRGGVALNGKPLRVGDHSEIQDAQGRNVELQFKGRELDILYPDTNQKLVVKLGHSSGSISYAPEGDWNYDHDSILGFAYAHHHQPPNAELYNIKNLGAAPLSVPHALALAVSPTRKRSPIRALSPHLRSPNRTRAPLHH